MPLLKHYQVFPGDPMVKNPPANAGDMSLIPGPGRIHMLQSNQAQASDYWSSHTLEPMLHNKRRYHNGKPTLQQRVAPIHHS